MTGQVLEYFAGLEPETYFALWVMAVLAEFLLFAATVAWLTRSKPTRRPARHRRRRAVRPVRRAAHQGAHR